ncbi:CRISPR-associated protein Cas5 [Sulfoacidibacillus thermotolerans]|uniref:Type I-B CRISPR-associated protein Cas5 n=1 Tax=Sulfoacidibacillus thermotolerans TaxID=1765684 RepID=A0A2U3D6V8_SULT2|nr:CRISPR-associated protein Cas5 [Sulfoacidibacillus thermotolerans]PWI57012.1 hypothetical protein BM613_10640 [Sulfoacidibacillus thermotolerans]
MSTPDRIVVFELRGHMAHFRKIYTNSSSLTYLVPPRTTLSGIIAAILGLNRDSYYQLLGPEQSWITVSLRTKVRTIMQTMNNLFIKSPSELSGVKGHTQVPTEIVVSQTAGDLIYRVFFAHQDESLVSELADRIVQHAPAYPVSLGTGPMLASIHPIAIVAVEDVRLTPPERDVSVVTPCLMEDVEKLVPSINTNLRTEVIKDLMPYSFDPGRRNGWNREFLYERQGLPMTVRLRRPSLRIFYPGDAGNAVTDEIVFAEEVNLLS